MPGSRADSTRGLQDSIDRLTNAFDRFAQRVESLEANGNGYANSNSDLFSRHIYRYLPFYVLLAIFALVVVLVPLRDDDGPAEQASQVSADATPTTGDALAATDDSTSARVAGQTVSQEPGTASTPTEVAQPVGFDPLGWNQAGKTKGGFDCKPDVRQIPWSAYAAPCYPAWSGNNGGATYRGVTDKEIVIVRRKFPESANSQAVDAVVAQAGGASTEVTDAARLEFVKYFNKVFEMWGRQVKLIEWESQFGDSTAEAQGRGKEGACADTNIIVNDLKAFGVMDGGAAFSECAAERKLMVFDAAGYYPESFYKKYHPYLWGGVPDCERISYQLAEYYGKRLGGKPAKWAKGVEKGKPRKYAMYIPDNDAYQMCGNIMEQQMQSKYGVAKGVRYNYVLDISRFPDEAAKAIIQFKAAGATTILLACDPISPIFLTQSAQGQAYNPEWVLLGVALTDVDNVPRLWDSNQVRGSLFGMSQLGPTAKILGPDGESPKTYKAATGTKLAAGTDGGYFTTMRIFSVLQATGPALTPENIAAAHFRLPPGGAPDFEVGYTFYQDGPDGKKGAHDHTAIEDAREVWWNPDADGYDGVKGAYIQTYGGKRFRNGEWPREDPPVFK
ncbi:MAG: hypothetical protein WD646_09205 [Actinomycetota bacterium]